MFRCSEKNGCARCTEDNGRIELARLFDRVQERLPKEPVATAPQITPEGVPGRARARLEERRPLPMRSAKAHAEDCVSKPFGPQAKGESNSGSGVIHAVTPTSSRQSNRVGSGSILETLEGLAAERWLPLRVPAKESVVCVWTTESTEGEAMAVFFTRHHTLSGRANSYASSLGIIDRGFTATDGDACSLRMGSIGKLAPVEHLLSLQALGLDAVRLYPAARWGTVQAKARVRLVLCMALVE